MREGDAIGSKRVHVARGRRGEAPPTRAFPGAVSMVGAGPGHVPPPGVEVTPFGRWLRWVGWLAALAVLAGACAEDGATAPSPASLEAEPGDSSATPDGPAAQVHLEALVTAADVPEGYVELDAGSEPDAWSLARTLDNSSCWSADIETEAEAVSRFFLDDGIHGRLVASGMALLPTDTGAEFTDALATMAPCTKRSTDGVWETAVASDTRIDSGNSLDAVLQFTVTKEQLGSGEGPFTVRLRVLRRGDIVGWVSAREDDFPSLAEVATTNFIELVVATSASDAPVPPTDGDGGRAVRGSAPLDTDDVCARARATVEQHLTAAGHVTVTPSIKHSTWGEVSGTEASGDVVQYLSCISEFELGGELIRLELFLADLSHSTTNSLHSFCSTLTPIPADTPSLSEVQSTTGSAQVYDCRLGAIPTIAGVASTGRAWLAGYHASYGGAADPPALDRRAVVSDFLAAVGFDGTAEPGVGIGPG